MKKKHFQLAVLAICATVLLILLRCCRAEFNGELISFEPLERVLKLWQK